MFQALSQMFHLTITKAYGKCPISFTCPPYVRGMIIVIAIFFLLMLGLTLGLIQLLNSWGI